MSAGGPLRLCSSSSEYREEGEGGNGVENPSSTTGSPLPQLWLWQWLPLAELKLLEVEGGRPSPAAITGGAHPPLTEHVMAAVHSLCPL